MSRGSIRWIDRSPASRSTRPATVTSVASSAPAIGDLDRHLVARDLERAGRRMPRWGRRGPVERHRHVPAARVIDPPNRLGRSSMKTSTGRRLAGLVDDRQRVAGRVQPLRLECPAHDLVRPATHPSCSGPVATGSVADVRVDQRGHELIRRLGEHPGGRVPWDSMALHDQVRGVVGGRRRRRAAGWVRCRRRCRRRAPGTGGTATSRGSAPTRTPLCRQLLPSVGKRAGR